MKGAVDGGLYIPHKDKRFPKKQRKFVLGSQVALYMKKLEESNPEAYRRQFSRYIKEGIKADDLEAIYKKAHKAIRANPEHVKSTRPQYKLPKAQIPKMTFEEKRAALNKRLAAAGLPPRE